MLSPGLFILAQNNIIMSQIIDSLLLRSTYLTEWDIVLD